MIPPDKPITYEKVQEQQDVEETLADLPLYARPTHRKPWTRSPYLFTIDIALLILVTILLTSQRNSKHLEMLGDITGYAPQFDHKIVTFKSRPEFISNHTSEESLRQAREYWKTLVPPGQGFIEVDPKDASRYDLPKLIEWEAKGKSGAALGTSIVHSIHCLYAIMSEYDLLAQGLQAPDFDSWHMDHCFDYVLQELMCAGDTALAGEDFPGGSSQWDVPHVCKDWDQIYAWLDANRNSNAWQFGEEQLHWVPPD